MNIMISGASGLVGRDLIRPLLKENHKIIAVYRSKNKIRKKISHKNLMWKKVDLKHPINLKQRVDVIVHCAVAHPFSKKNKIDHYVSSNILSLINLVDFAKRSKTKMIINFSSLKIYGQVNVGRLSEEYIPSKQDFLGITKQFSETFLFEQPINFINLRLPGVLCSTRNTPRPWLQTLINKVKKNNNIKVHNINNYFNNVIDTEEISRFILAIIKKRQSIRGAYHLSASKPIKLKNIISIIKKKYNSKSKIKNTKSKNRSFVILIDKIQKQLNFKPLSTKEILFRNL